MNRIRLRSRERSWNGTNYCNGLDTQSLHKFYFYIMNDTPDFGCHHFKILPASSLHAPMSIVSLLVPQLENLMECLHALQAVTCVALQAMVLFSTHVVI